MKVMKKNVGIAAKIATEFGIKTVDLTDFPSELAEEIYRVLNKFFPLYPEVIRNIDRISSIQSYNRYSYELGYGIRRESKETYARSYKGAKGKICFNRNWLKNYSDFINEVKSLEENGYFAKYTGTPIGIFVHEFGHQLHNFLRSKRLDRVELYYDQAFPLKQISKELSRYATEDRREFFAESFAEYYCSPEPSAISIEVMSNVENTLKEWRREQEEKIKESV